MRSKHATPLFVARDRLPPPWMKSIRNVTLAESGVGIGRPAYRERYYRGYHDYDSPRVYSERRYRRGPQVYERDSYRWRDRDWD